MRSSVFLFSSSSCAREYTRDVAREKEGMRARKKSGNGSPWNCRLILLAPVIPRSLPPLFWHRGTEVPSLRTLLARGRVDPHRGKTSVEERSFMNFRLDRAYSVVRSFVRFSSARVRKTVVWTQCCWIATRFKLICDQDFWRTSIATQLSRDSGGGFPNFFISWIDTIFLFLSLSSLSLSVKVIYVRNVFTIFRECEGGWPIVRFRRYASETGETRPEGNNLFDKRSATIVGWRI